MKIFNIALVLAIAVVALLVPFPLSSAHEQVGACSLYVARSHFLCGADCVIFVRNINGCEQ